ncbi:MAG: chemotaxis protein CheC [Bacillota bacterium]|jgi:chemotaxis protein CheC|nr:chemotaxis protein CheC [Bacillota bacterium]MDD3297317.1 chemotaxis protein CheC [Bacillota bacterium]MDD3850110.1 chemotaxis protein CheC [Bacillota bacterium]MDD4706833.1 chemotaxis protein CheC [Bacillota bacterium]
MTMDYQNMTSMQMDVLKELGNIGAGNAVTALSKMLDKKVNMEVPRVSILEFREVSEILGGAEAEVTGVYFRMEGDISGNIMFLLPVDSSNALLDMLMGTYRDNDKFGEMSLSALEEIGNILTGSYISSLSTMTGMNIKISVPALAIDMAGAVLSVPIIQFGHMGDSVLLIETHFFEGKTHVKGNFLLIPDLESFANLLEKLGVA